MFYESCIELLASDFYLGILSGVLRVDVWVKRKGCLMSMTIYSTLLCALQVLYPGVHNCTYKFVLQYFYVFERIISHTC